MITAKEAYETTLKNNNLYNENMGLINELIKKHQLPILIK